MLQSAGDARASYRVKMPGPEVPFDHAEETETILLMLKSGYKPCTQEHIQITAK